MANKLPELKSLSDADLLVIHTSLNALCLALSQDPDFNAPFSGLFAHWANASGARYLVADVIAKRKEQPDEHAGS